MSCPNNDCHPVTTPCVEIDDCGCLNPSTFLCTTYTGEELPGTGVQQDDDGNVVLKKVDDAIVELQGKAGKVLVDSDDVCPKELSDKLEPGLNISIQEVGTGCNRKLRIDSTTGGVAVDVSVKASSADTTASYLNNKVETGDYLAKVITSPGANEKVKIDVVPAALISGDSGNQLSIGTDGGIKTSFAAPDGSETKIIEGTGVDVSGSGTVADPYIIATNPSILALRSCFTGVWNDVTVVAPGNANVVHMSGTPKFRIRHDGTIEFKGSMTYTVSFGANTSGTRKFTVPAANIPTTCLSAGEQAGTADLKSINYIDAVGATYGYIIRKSAQNIILEFQSSFTTATPKTIVVNFEGAVSHPTI